MSYFAPQRKLLLLLRSASPLEGNALDQAVMRQFVTPLTSSPAGGHITSVVLNPVKMQGFREETNRGRHIWSAIVEIFLDGEAAVDALLAQPVLAKPDRTVFEEVVTLAIAEKMVFGEDRSQADLPIKIFNLYKASDRAHSHRRWAAHADFGKSSGVDSIMPKYAQNATLPGYHAIGGRYDYDGSSISWMRSIEDANSIFCNKEFMATSDADGLEMGIHVEDVIDILTDERSIYERAGADGRRAVEVETTH